MRGIDEELRERARARASRAHEWPVRVYRLGEEPARDPLDASSVEQRILWMWPLAKEAWAIAGLPIPDYTRANMPGVMLRKEH